MSYNQFIAALCLWREGRNLSTSALAGIWAVIRNRMSDPKKRWPQTVPGVVLQPAQFSSFNQNSVDAKFPVNDGGPDWLAWIKCLNVVVTYLSDPTNGANHYEDCVPGQLPSWADPAALTVTIEGMRFYKL